jgi:DNA-binding NarL/FixJ family response regulator
MALMSALTRIRKMASSILVVDDSEYFRLSAAEFLAARGYELLEVATDGEAALAAANRACPDGVLLDVNLPGRNGFAIAASLAAECPRARIVLTSSDIDDVPHATLNACGAVAFVPKVDLATADLDRIFGG